MKRTDLKGKMYDDLPRRLRTQAKNVELDGWCSAARLMRNAADTIEYLLGEEDGNAASQ